MGSCQIPTQIQNSKICSKIKNVSVRRLVFAENPIILKINKCIWIRSVQFTESQFYSQYNGFSFEWQHFRNSSKNVGILGPDLGRKTVISPQLDNLQQRDKHHPMGSSVKHTLWAQSSPEYIFHVALHFFSFLEFSKKIPIFLHILTVLWIFQFQDKFRTKYFLNQK